MSLIDVLIIYLACGAPSSVFELTRTDHRSAPGKLRCALTALFFWPVHLCILAGLAISSVRQRTKEDKIHAIRKQIESAIFDDVSSRRVFEFRDGFYRLASLSHACASAGPRRRPDEIFRVVGHPHAALAVRCAARRDWQKISDHLERTTDEVCEIIETQAARRSTVSPGQDFREVATELNALLPTARRRLCLDVLAGPARANSSPAARSPLAEA